MNSKLFEEWFRRQVLPNIAPNSVTNGQCFLSFDEAGKKAYNIVGKITLAGFPD